MTDAGVKTQKQTAAGSKARRDQIIDEATALFLEYGYAATSMSKLAEACQIQKPSLYHHFASKEALFVACVSQGYDAAIARLRVICDDPHLDDEGRLRAALQVIYQIMAASPAGRMSPIIAETSRQIPSVARAFHDQLIDPMHEIIHQIIDRGEASGTFVALDRLGLEHLIFGPVVSLSLSREMFASFEAIDELYPVDQVSAAHTDLLLRMLKGQAAVTSP